MFNLSMTVRSARGGNSHEFPPLVLMIIHFSLARLNSAKNNKKPKISL